MVRPSRPALVVMLLLVASVVDAGARERDVAVPSLGHGSPRAVVPRGPELPRSDEAAQQVRRRAPGPGLETVRCWFEVGDEWPETVCYRMHVHARFGDGSSPLISFPVVQFRAFRRGDDSAPVLHLGGGGPGNAVGLGREQIDGDLWRNYQHLSVAVGRDLYIMDPRGAGAAEPVLVCTEYLKSVPEQLAQALTVRETLAKDLADLERCRDRLTAQGVMLDTFNSAAVAHDVELLRKALGLSRWHLYGVSYATRYALTIAREYPRSVVSMVLDGAVFPQIRYSEKAAKDMADAFQRAFGQCEGSGSCARRFKDLDRRFAALVEMLDEHPLFTTITHPTTFERMNVVLTGERLVQVVFQSIYDEHAVGALPELIASLEHRNVDLVAWPLRQWVTLLLDPTYGDGSAISHFCFEEHPFVDYEKARAAARTVSAPFAQLSELGLAYQASECAMWISGTAPEVEGRPVRTPIPTLFLHGALDPVLPVTDLERAMTHTPNAAAEVFDDIAHDVIAGSACAERMAGVFFEVGLEYSAFVDC